TFRNDFAREFLGREKEKGIIWRRITKALLQLLPLALLFGAAVYGIINLSALNFSDSAPNLRRDLNVLPSEAKMVIAPDALNVVWDPVTKEKVDGASEKVIALATLNTPVYIISDDHAMRTDENFEASIRGRIEPARYIRCSGAGISDPRWDAAPV